MLQDIEYSSAIKDMPLLFAETRRTALLICDGNGIDDIIGLSVEDNIYQLSKERRRKDLPRKIMSRLVALNSEQLKMLAFGDEQTAKLVTLLAVIKTDRLFCEFMREVYADGFLSGKTVMSNTDFVVFFERKIQESERVATWTKSNLEDVRNVYKRILVEVGLAKKSGSDLAITRPLCDTTELAIIRNGNEAFADAILLY